MVSFLKIIAFEKKYIFNKDKVKKNQFLEPEISIHEDLNEVNERRINSIFVNRKFNPNVEVQKGQMFSVQILTKNSSHTNVQNVGFPLSLIKN